MSAPRSRTNIDRSEYYGAMQRIVDALFYEEEQRTVAMRAEAAPAGFGRVSPDAPDAAVAEAERVVADVAIDAESASSVSFAAHAAAVFGVSERTASLLGLAALAGMEARPSSSFAAGAAVASVPVGDAPSATGSSVEEEKPFTVRRLDVVIAAETADLPDELMRIVNLLPPGDYTRQRLCDQINSAITGHAWGQVYGTVS